MDDIKHMKRALALAKKAMGKTSPNPMVGCVIVKHGRVIAEGFHKRAGTPHAEAVALDIAGDKARGAALYVNLEPCCHTDKKTPPCADAIIKAGIRRVVAAMLDPNPKVAGKGMERLRHSGIEIKSGVLESEAKELNESYIKFITTKKPFVILKTAMTLDGKIATPEGESKWITGEKARKHVHALRNSVDAVLTAIGTAKADDPELTCRIKGGKNPIRILIDPLLEIGDNARLLKSPPQTIMVTKTKNERSAELEGRGVKFVFYEGVLHLQWLMHELGKTGITSLMIEGGSSLNSHALDDGIVDKVMFFIAPKIIGGKDSYPAVGGKTFKKLSEAYKITNLKIKRLGEDILIEGRVGE